MTKITHINLPKINKKSLLLSHIHNFLRTSLTILNLNITGVQVTNILLDPLHFPHIIGVAFIKILRYPRVVIHLNFTKILPEIAHSYRNVGILISSLSSILIQSWFQHHKRWLNSGLILLLFDILLKRHYWLVDLTI